MDGMIFFFGFMCCVFYACECIAKDANSKEYFVAARYASAGFFWLFVILLVFSHFG